MKKKKRNKFSIEEKEKIVRSVLENNASYSSVARKNQTNHRLISLWVDSYKANKPNQKWATDVTEFSLFGTKSYLSPIIDLYNGEIVSYNITYRPTLDLVMDMIEYAFEKIPDDTNLILHSDQGWHYQHNNYRHKLKSKGIRQSMSRKGNCLDNAIIENFFGLLKSELLYLQEFKSMEHFHHEVKVCINYYNNKRIKASLNGLSSVFYRTQSI